ncbi:LysE/ArgO family amino acid transporter [Sinorhizobium sp. BG8]|uniref:LysE/ArgO family amino acid transporter n=1 Tax=Sinorhizobium sp. BG8 TaxID=2613773 RepID=UPI00193CE327|nr:LysE/ArgO family amino acid transporter [Sinorhizobium sp. BG8]QRM56012.1 amino acid transporter [Sinorhizobium sp. BG8]
MDFTAYSTGLTVGLSLILAIGAQNAFVLRQGLRGEHVFAVCLACAVSDGLLIAAGVSGFGKASALMPWITPVLRYGGAAFLAWYGIRSLKSALHSTQALRIEETRVTSLAATLGTCLALTWLNPHVYLDTVVLLGTISTQYPGRETAFGAGALTASFLFFFALGYGAAWLRPVFARPASWRILEAMIALMMWIIAARLVVGS